MSDMAKLAAGRLTPVPHVDLAAWLASVADGSWTWPRNTRCKYVTLKIDTRSGAYRIEDRDGNPITFDELVWQFSSATPQPTPLKDQNDGQ